ncbi:MAG: SMC-Scp complex subunit ScpB [Candidatus Onthomonas sp.]
MEKLEPKDMESALEAILFAAGEPIGADRLCLALELDRNTVDSLCKQLADRYSYDRRGIRLLRLGDNYQLCSAPEYADRIRKAFERRKPPQLSQPALEVLTIIAYFQPTTRAYVEQVRGVDSSYTVNLLLERGLIEEAGRLAVPGRPTLFRTTDRFLRCFSLSSLDELPPLPQTGEEAKLTQELQQAAAMLQAEQETPPEQKEE